MKLGVLAQHGAGMTWPVLDRLFLVAISPFFGTQRGRARSIVVHGAPRPGRARLSRSQFCSASFTSLHGSCITRRGPFSSERHHSPTDRSSEPRSAEGNVAP